MKGKQYTVEFKAEAVKQVVEKGHAVVEVAKRLGVSDKSLYVWVNKARATGAMPSNRDQALRAENVRLKAELKRTTEERDILKKAAVDSTGQSNVFDTIVLEVEDGTDGTARFIGATEERTMGALEEGANDFGDWTRAP